MSVQVSAIDEPWAKRFKEQWAAYVQYIYAANQAKAEQKATIDKDWFDKQVSQITFDNVFNNSLWMATSKYAMPYTMLGGYERLELEELLPASHELFQSAPNGPSGKEALSTQLSYRRNRCKTRLYAAYLDEWCRQHLPTLRSTDAKFDAGTVCFCEGVTFCVSNVESSEGILSVIDSRRALKELIKGRHEDWSKTLEQAGDAKVAGMSEDWSQTAKQWADRNMKELEAGKTTMQKTLGEYTSRCLFRRWDGVLRDCLKRTINQCPTDAVIDLIADEWPVLLANPRPHNLFRATKRNDESKHTSASLLPQVQQILDNQNSRTLTEWTSKLRAVLNQVEQQDIIDFAPEPEPIKARQAMYAAAMQVCMINFWRLKISDNRLTLGSTVTM